MLSACSTSDLPFVQEDCGYSAYYVLPKNGAEPELHFSIVTAEVLDGERHCRFGYIRTRVKGATTRGVEMKEIAKEKDEYAYATFPDFDPRKDVVSIDVNGTVYSSKPETVKQVGDNVYVELHR
jgi:hypothetical protein